MDFLGGMSADFLKGVGLTGVVVIIVLMILTDRLVTAGRLREMRNDRDKWQKAFEASEEARRTQLDQTHTVVVELGQTVDKFTRELQTLATVRQRGGRS